MKFANEGRKWRIPGLMYADDLVLTEKDMYHFIEVCQKNKKGGVSLKMIEGKIMVMF